MPNESGAVSAYTIVSVPLAELEPFQIRSTVRERHVTALMASIGTVGQQVPIRVCRVENGRRAILDGNCRVLAMKRLGHTECDAIIDEASLTKAGARLRQLASFCREDIDPIERGHALDEVLRESGMTAAKVASSSGMSEAMISRYRALVGVRIEVAKLVSAGKLGMSLAVPLSLTAPEERFEELLRRAQAGTLTRADLDGNRKRTRRVRSVAAPKPRRRSCVIQLGRGCSLRLGAAIGSVGQAVELMAEYVRRFREGAVDSVDGMPVSAPSA